MQSFFFQKDEFVAPAPRGYVEMTVRRALWQNLGLRPEDMSARDYFRYVAYLSEEARSVKKNDG